MHDNSKSHPTIDEPRLLMKSFDDGPLVSRTAS